MEFGEILGSFTSKPCDKAMAWLLTQVSLADAWNNCSLVDWLLWALIHSRINPRLCLNIFIEFHEQEQGTILPANLINQIKYYAERYKWLHKHNPYISPAGEKQETI